MLSLLNSVNAHLPVQVLDRCNEDASPFDSAAACAEGDVDAVKVRKTVMKWTPEEDELLATGFAEFGNCQLSTCTAAICGCTNSSCSVLLLCDQRESVFCPLLLCLCTPVCCVMVTARRKPRFYREIISLGMVMSERLS